MTFALRKTRIQQILNAFPHRRPAFVAGLLAVLVALSVPATLTAQNEDAPDADAAAVDQNDERSTQVRLSDDGLLVGQLGILSPAGGEFVPVQGVDIQFAQNGEVLQRVKPGPQGVFQVPLEPGIYAVIAGGTEGFAAFGLHVLPSAGDGIDSPVQILATLIPPNDIPLAKTLAGYRIRALNLPQATYNPDLVELQTGPKVTTVQHHVARLQISGELPGVVQTLDPESGDPIPIGNADIFFIRDGRILDRSMSEDDGSFVARNVRTGVYSVVCVSERGFAAFAVQVLPPLNNGVLSRKGETPVQFVNFQQIPELLLIATMIDQGNMNLVQQSLTDSSSEGLAGGGGAGGFGSGAGGYGGSGVAQGANFTGPILGGLLGGAIGWYLSEQDDDGNRGRRSLASPPAP